LIEFRAILNIFKSGSGLPSLTPTPTHDLARDKYSPLRVSTLITSPSSINNGTRTTAPDSSVAGSGPIYQITKSFRRNESGRQHNPEFTMLEWYRPNFNHHDLMDEINLFLQFTLGTSHAEKISYRELFLKHLNIDPLQIDLKSLKKLIAEKNIIIDMNGMDHDTCLQILLTHLIEPSLGVEKPLFLYDFPPSQAALSKIRQDNPAVAERFELYINGSEIANGFHELTDPLEQKKRFEKNQSARKQNQQFIPEIDYYFIDALQSLPNCAGVAIGVDRLLMQYTKTRNIQDVICFPFEQA